jgi:3-dehydroquinate synthase II
MDRPAVWVRLSAFPDSGDRVEAATSAIETGADALVIPKGTRSEFDSLARVRLVEERGDELVEDDETVGRIIEIGSAEDVAIATEALATEGVVMLVTQDWTVIPLEDLVAAQRGEDLPGVLLAQIGSVEDARLAMGALEHGVDGVVVLPRDPLDARTLVHEIRAMTGGTGELALTEARVVRVKTLGQGDRACVDTTDLLVHGEGMLVGSSSAGLFLVHGETVENPYAAVRPFRVNAGAVHSYILVPGGRTRYLSEMAAGTEVLLVGREGEVRASHVGRLKVERRPLILLEAEAKGRTFSTILQNAETVRLVTPEGHVSVTSLEEGHTVLVHLPGLEDGAESAEKAGSGRHFGRAVPERIIEG